MILHSEDGVINHNRARCLGVTVTYILYSAPLMSRIPDLADLSRMKHKQHQHRRDKACGRRRVGARLLREAPNFGFSCELLNPRPVIIEKMRSLRRHINTFWRERGLIWLLARTPRCSSAMLGKKRWATGGPDVFMLPVCCITQVTRRGGKTAKQGELWRNAKHSCLFRKTVAEPHCPTGCQSTHTGVHPAR